MLRSQSSNQINSLMFALGHRSFRVFHNHGRTFIRAAFASVT